MTWPASPAGAMREYVGALRAVWRAWQTGERLNVRGENYRLTLMTPFFSPPPIEHPSIPIYLAGVNPGMVRLAGECADGLHVHPLHSELYLRDVVGPALRAGAARGEREPSGIEVSASVFAVTDAAEAALARNQIAFYASTPAYRPLLDLHGWGEAAERLSGLARQGAWTEMGAQITDEMLETFAVVAPSGELGRALARRYTGLADRLTLYLPFRLGERDAFWKSLVGELAMTPSVGRP
jgi:probable F420-dependent oxidoreductase